MSLNPVNTPDEAIQALAAAIAPVPSINICDRLLGRVLAQPIRSDRDSPAADVSAMDGYAIWGRQLEQSGEIVVQAQCAAGSPPPPMPTTGVVRIFTGALVPDGADRVIQREHTIESPANGRSNERLGTVVWRDVAKTIREGANIRRQGENLRAGEIAVPSGIVVRGPQAAAIASFGVRFAPVYAMVRVAVITTGDELKQKYETGEPMPAWQIRNSNAVALSSLLATRSYVDPVTLRHAADDPDELREVIQEMVSGHDLVLLTGGVSMGDHDYVPAVLQSIGAETLFHKLPLRPGRPILGAMAWPDSAQPASREMAADQAASQDRAVPIIGLPGNPVSATMGCVRFAMPLIDKLAGINDWRPAPGVVSLDDIGPKTLPLHWFRAVKMIAPGVAELVIGKGSGDLVSLAVSDGFIEMPPHANDSGPWPFYPW